jgi:hypothetical protein
MNPIRFVALAPGLALMSCSASQFLLPILRARHTDVPNHTGTKTKNTHRSGTLTPWILPLDRWVSDACQKSKFGSLAPSIRAWKYNFFRPGSIVPLDILTAPDPRSS